MTPSPSTLVSSDNQASASGFRTLAGIVLGYLAYLLAMQPQWMLGGEMYAEMGSNYYGNALSKSFIDKFFATDAGYIPLPQRLIAFAVSAFDPAAIPYLYTWISATLTALLIGSFSLPIYRAVVKDDALRIATCALVLIVVDFETRTFFNFTYFGIFFAGALAALAYATKGRDMPKWGWFLPVLMLSKPYLPIPMTQPPTRCCV